MQLWSVQVHQVLPFVNARHPEPVPLTDLASEKVMDLDHAMPSL